MRSLFKKSRDSKDSKKQIQKIPDIEQIEIDLPRVAEKGGLFYLFKHKVTGNELNTLIARIQNHLIQFNNIHSKMINELNQVYKTIDVLDEENINKLTMVVKSVEEAHRQTKEIINKSEILSLLSQCDLQEKQILRLNRGLRISYIIAGGSAVVAIISIAMILYYMWS